ncbi:hypothetical protein F8135_20090 [Pseudomonas aeruginosa]|nr:hypothetical protein F8135_20090 [Pseudomonas aeruginosa]
MSSRLVVEAAQRLYEFESTPEQEAERIERLQAFREQLDPLNLAPHAEAFNEAPDEALRPEQAEAERPEVDVTRILLDIVPGDGDGHEVYAKSVADVEAKLAADGDRIEDLELKLHAALARVAELESATSYIEVRQCVNCRHIGINDAADYAACHDCRWTGPEPDEDKCPGCAGENCMAAACPECGGRYELVAEANIATPVAQAGQVPQAWLDVQAERRRQVEAEGWTPEHDDEHSHGQMARASACYALAGSSAPNDGTAALLVSLAWPWDEQWWKPSTARRDLVKAGALVLAEIERLDLAGISQSPQPGATTASS